MTNQRPRLLRMSHLALWLLAASSPACEVRCSRGGGSTAAPVTPTVAGPFTTRPPEQGPIPAPESVTRTTAQFFVAWAHPTLHSNEPVRFQLVAVNVGAAAPPGTAVVETTMNAVAEGANHGVATFSMPTAGWPPGQYRVVGSTGAGPFSQVDFTIP